MLYFPVHNLNLNALEKSSFGLRKDGLYFWHIQKYILHIHKNNTSYEEEKNEA